MKKEHFIAIFNQSIQFISGNWKSRCNNLLHDEHWNVIGERVFHYLFDNTINHNPLPVFIEEIISDFPSHYKYFEKIKYALEKNENELAQIIAKTIEETPIESLLVILGQRKTPATIINENGIPPLKDQLLESCFELYNEQICKAARAREKHISRIEGDTFWGRIEGTPDEKEQVAKIIVRRIIDDEPADTLYSREVLVALHFSK